MNNHPLNYDLHYRLFPFLFFPRIKSRSVSKMDVQTRLLILSDTHAGKGLAMPDLSVDVAIHCGDLTDESKMNEFRSSLGLLRSIKAPLKLVIAGNHDFTLDAPAFRKKAAQAQAVLEIEPELIKKEYGDFGEARQLFAAPHRTDDEKASSGNIVLLDEGMHHFDLENGARLTVYASPFTPSLEADWGVQFKRGEHHDFAIDKTVDVVITHGPPKGILDVTASRQRAGCEHLFRAVATARPQLHCFGHIHEGWGAKLVAWRDNPSESPSHLTDIKNESSVVIESLATLRPGKWDDAETRREKEQHRRELQMQGYCRARHCVGSSNPNLLRRGQNTLFVNASIEALDEDGAQLPWVVDIQLPAAS